MKVNVERVLLVVSIITTIVMGISLGIYKGKTTPTTVYITGCNETIPIEQLDIPPLEELK